ncbi:septum formation family protein [Corynebacterium sp. TA-R-1]|uniref:Septum formation family protein n=1 Tax=Corynebacterium stercoris TaxID=2943490 RepID=A0ABT1G0H9_9CORY|nr:septum formation family protein [Corynebacterium stercoris]MCP1387518.1 septum formation family protein [Corynebacterium stercoris]
MASSGLTRTSAARAFMVAALAGSVGVGSYGFVAERAGQPDTGATTQAQTGTTVAETSGNQPSASESAMTFTTADQGSCLTWTVGPDGAISGFEQADCEGEHRFEVSLREDLGTYPTSEFGPDAPMPSQTRQAQLREELCGAATIRYLDGRYDPTGRYSIAPILPPAAAWEKGDRTMLCGLQETDRSGAPILTTGRVADQDQARVFEPGQCVAVDQTNSLTVVDCAEPHQMEITSKVSLASVFPDHTPAVEEQDAHLGDVCTAAAQDYLGGEENLYQITLQPFWTTQKPAAWDGGSRSVNCALVSSRPEGQFAELSGTALGGREQLLIDGAPPAERPERRPLRSETGAGGAGEAAPAPDAEAPQ